MNQRAGGGGGEIGGERETEREGVRVIKAGRREICRETEKRLAGTTQASRVIDLPQSHPDHTLRLSPAVKPSYTLSGMGTYSGGLFDEVAHTTPPLTHGLGP